MIPYWITHEHKWKDVVNWDNIYNIHNLNSTEVKTQEEERLRLENSFYEFIKAAWPVVEGKQNLYYDNWHIKALADHLQATLNGTILDLILNLPPRMGKSTIVGVMFPAWVWCKSPHKSFLFASISQTLALRDSVRCRSLITSPWYQNLWGHKVKLKRDANSKKRYYNTGGGFRMVTSIGGSTVGEGADFLLMDDPNSRESTDSPVQRERINLWYDGTFCTRVSNPKTTVNILTQQRFHERDMTGYLLQKENSGKWVHLCIPMEYEDDRKTKTIILPGTHKMWEDPRTKDGELLWPSLWGKTEVEKKKKELNSSYFCSGQLQQRPTPIGGSIIKGDEWFNYWTREDLPPIQYIIQSWDTALSTTAESCYSACTTWGIFDYGLEENPNLLIPQIILLSSYRAKLEFPDLRYMAKKLYNNYNDVYLDRDMMRPIRQPDKILIETKANGESLLQELRRAGVPAMPFNPSKQKTNFGESRDRTAGKVARARLASSLIEGGRVWLPTKGPNFTKLKGFAEEFLEACNTFPMKESNDLVDSMSQAFISIQKSGLVYHPTDDPPYVDPKPWERGKKLYG